MIRFYNIVYYLFIFILIFSPSCIYQEKMSEERVFYVESLYEFNSSDICLIIGGGSYQLFSKKNNKFIYKIVFDKVRWSTSKGLINKDISHPYISE